MATKNCIIFFEYLQSLAWEQLEALPENICAAMSSCESHSAKSSFVKAVAVVKNSVNLLVGH